MAKDKSRCISIQYILILYNWRKNKFCFIRYFFIRVPRTSDQILNHLKLVHSSILDEKFNFQYLSLRLMNFPQKYYRVARQNNWPDTIIWMTCKVRSKFLHDSMTRTEELLISYQLKFPYQLSNKFLSTRTMIC